MLVASHRSSWSPLPSLTRSGVPVELARVPAPRALPHRRRGAADRHPDRDRRESPIMESVRRHPDTLIPRLGAPFAAEYVTQLEPGVPCAPTAISPMPGSPRSWAALSAGPVFFRTVGLCPPTPAAPDFAGQDRVSLAVVWAWYISGAAHSASHHRPHLRGRPFAPLRGSGDHLPDVEFISMREFALPPLRLRTPSPRRRSRSRAAAPAPRPEDTAPRRRARHALAEIPESAPPEAETPRPPPR